MPFNRPTLPQLIARVAGDLEAGLPGADARLRRQVLTILGRAQSGVTHGLYGHLAWLAGVLLPDTQEEEYLAVWAAVKGVPRKDPEFAGGLAPFTGTTGAVIPAGTILQRSDGVEFVTDAEATLVAGAASVAITASEPGAGANTASGSTLTLTSPLDGVNTNVLLSADLAGGADLESIPAWSGRVLAAFRDAPGLGTADDYLRWGLEVPTVTRTWCVPRARGNGTVDLYLVCDDQEGSIIPAAPVVAAVQAHIDPLLPEDLPADGFLAKAPVADPLDVTIAIEPATQEVKDAVTAELADLLRREAQVEDGSGNGTILVSHLREAISTAAGEVDHLLTVPAGNVPVAIGALATPGVITWA